MLPVSCRRHCRHRRSPQDRCCAAQRPFRKSAPRLSRAHSERRTVMVESLRMDITKFAPDAYKHLFGIEHEIARNVDKSLLHLVKVRASQINGCAFCIGMHSDEALRDGEKPERLLMLDAWHESGIFNDKERAALEWVEEITLIADGHAHKDAFDALKPHFSEDEIGWLTL